MKKIFSILLAVSVLLSYAVMPTYADLVETPASAVAYVEGGENADENLGATALRVNGNRVGTVADDIKKGYIRVPLDVSVETAETIELSLTAVSGGQTVSVYGVDMGVENIANEETYGYSNVHNWNSGIITWANAIGNDRFGNGVSMNAIYEKTSLGEIAVDGPGEYTLDVTDYIKAVWASTDPNPPYATFILTGDSVGEEVVFNNVETSGGGIQYQTIINENYNNYNFMTNNTVLGQVYKTGAYIGADYGKDMTSFGYTGGNGNTWRNDYYEGADGFSIRVGRKTDSSISETGSGGRVRFYNALYSADDPSTGLKQSDIGRKFEVSFDSMRTGTSTTSYKVGFMPHDASSAAWITGTIINNTVNSNGYINFVPGTNAWAKTQFTFEINSAMIADPLKTTFAIDVAHSTASSVIPAYIDNLSIREITDLPLITSPNSPKLISDDTTVTYALPGTYVMPNENARVNFGGGTIQVNGGAAIAETTEGAGKVYTKFDTTDYADAENVTLKFNTAEASNQTVDIYAIEDSNWNANTITWNNAPENATLVTSVDVTKAGEYKADVTNYIKNAGSTDITFILTTQNKYKAVFDENFESGFETFTSGFDYRVSGNGTPSLALEGTGNKELVLRSGTGAQTNTRLKLFKVFDNAPFGEGDTGRKFKISTDITIGQDFSTHSSAVASDGRNTARVRTGIMAAYYGTTTTVVGSSLAKDLFPEAPQKFSFEWDALVDGAALTIDGGTANNLNVAREVRIDNILVEEISEGFGIPFSIAPNSIALYASAPFEAVDTNVTGTIAAGETFAVTQTIENNSGADQNAVMIIAVYKGTRLLDVAIGVSTSLSCQTPTPISAALADLSSEYDNDCNIKVFIFDGTTNIKPLLPAVDDLLDEL